VDCATDQVASHWLLNREAWVQSQASPCRICDKVAMELISLQVLQFSPVSTIPPTAHTHNLSNKQCHEREREKKKNSRLTGR
jgi:hypothetical protein